MAQGYIAKYVFVARANNIEKRIKKEFVITIKNIILKTKRNGKNIKKNIMLKTKRKLKNIKKNIILRIKNLSSMMVLGVTPMKLILIGTNNHHCEGCQFERSREQSPKQSPEEFLSVGLLQSETSFAMTNKKNICNQKK